LLNFIDKFQFWLKWNISNGHFSWRPVCVSAHSFSRAF